MIIAERNSIAPTTRKNVATKTSYGFVEEAATRNSTKNCLLDYGMGGLLYAAKETVSKAKKRHLRKARKNVRQRLRRNHPEMRDRALTNDEVNLLLSEAYEADSKKGESLALSDFRRFGTYNPSKQVSRFFLSDNYDLSGQSIVLRCNSTYLEERGFGIIETPTSKDERGYTCQNLNPLLSADRSAIESELLEKGYGLKRSQALTVMGLLNHLLFEAAECAGIIEWAKGFEESQRIQSVHRGGAKRFAETAWTLWASLSSSVSSLAENWAGIETPSSRQSVRRAANLLKEWKLLDFESDYEPGVWGKSRRYRDVDVHRCLILFRILEEQIGGYEAMPTHHGSLIYHLWQAIFPGWGYGRKGDPDAAEPDEWEASDRYREWAGWRTRTDSGRYPDEDVVSRDLRCLFHRRLEEWREARASLGDCDFVTQLKESWQAMYLKTPALLGG